MENVNLGLIFLTGLTTGGLTCVALQGGLLASVLTSNDENDVEKKLTQQNKVVPIISFLVAKLLAYILLGMALGALGSLISLTPTMQGWFQIAIGIYLLGIAGAMLDLHPVFRYFIIKPPKFLARLVKKQTGSDSWIAPSMLGAMTVFLPCAVTQAMEIVALGTGNAIAGGLIMGAFILGTSPTFFLIGFIFSKAEQRYRSWFDKVAVTLMVVLAALSINTGMAVMGSIYTLQNFAKAAIETNLETGTKNQGSLPEIIDGVQTVTINVENYGYTPNSINLKKGVKTQLKLVTDKTQGCARAFTIPALRLQKILPVTGVETIEFTPTKSGPLVFSCSMGMYTGQFNVI